MVRAALVTYVVALCGGLATAQDGAEDVEITALGGCYSTTAHDVLCAFNSTYCEAGRVWVKPSELNNPCSCSDERAHLGACYDFAESHVATCTLNEEQCVEGHSWIASGHTYADDTQCKCDQARDVGFTMYGACYDMSTHSATCAVAPQDCAGNETWLDPKDAASFNVECPCHEVHTGSCFNSDSHSATCAIDADSCPDGDTWLDARTSAQFNVHCRLCAAEAPTEPDEPGETPDPDTDGDGSTGDVNVNVDVHSKHHDHDNELIYIVAGVLGGLVVVSLVLGVALFAKLSATANQRQQTDPAISMVAQHAMAVKNSESRV